MFGVSANEIYLQARTLASWLRALSLLILQSGKMVMFKVIFGHAVTINRC
jgi:hypothetical protein